MPRSIAYSIVGSTQEVALHLAKEGAPHGTAVTAETQLLGRGREGRSWSSPKGGLYSSIVLRPKAEAYPLLSLSAGLELHHHLARLVPLGHLAIRWPNDLMLAPLDGQRPARKVGGVLTDIVSRPGSPTFAVLGVGLNVDISWADLPTELHGKVASLREFSDRPIQPSELFQPIQDAITRSCERVSSPEGRKSLPQELEPHLFGLGRSVAVEGTRGTFCGIGEEGEALVELGGGGPPKAFRAGELTLEAP